MASGDDEILSSSSLHGEYMRPMSANMFIDSFLTHAHAIVSVAFMIFIAL